MFRSNSHQWLREESQPRSRLAESMSATLLQALRATPVSSWRAQTAKQLNLIAKTSKRHLQTQHRLVTMSYTLLCRKRIQTGTNHQRGTTCTEVKQTNHQYAAQPNPHRGLASKLSTGVFTRHIHTEAIPSNCHIQTLSS